MEARASARSSRSNSLNSNYPHSDRQKNNGREAQPAIGAVGGLRTLVPLEQLEFQLSPSDRQKNNGREAQPAIGAVGGLRWTVPCRAGNPGTRRQGRRRCHRRLRRTRAFRTCSPWCRSPSAGRRPAARHGGGEACGSKLTIVRALRHFNPPSGTRSFRGKRFPIFVIGGRFAYRRKKRTNSLLYGSCLAPPLSGRRGSLVSKWNVGIGIQERHEAQEQVRA